MLVGQESTCWVQGRWGVGWVRLQAGRKVCGIERWGSSLPPSFSSALSPAPLNLHQAAFSSLLAASSLSFISLLVCLSSSLDSFREVGSNRLCTGWLFCELSPWPLQQPCLGSQHPSCRPGQGRAGERCAGLHHALPSFGDSPDNLYILLAEAIC